MNRPASRFHRAQHIEELPAPVSTYDLLRQAVDEPHVVLLESSGAPSVLGRFSFFCSQPFLIFQIKGSRCFSGAPGDLRPLSGAPFEELSHLLARYPSEPSAWSPGLPPLLGGAVGYLGYELLHLLEDVPRVDSGSDGIPDACLLFCEQVIATDHLNQRSWAIATTFDDSAIAAKERADQVLTRALGRLSRLGSLPPERSQGEFDVHRRGRLAKRPRLDEDVLLQAGFRAAASRAGYLKTVGTARERIFAGDLFEVCTTNRFETVFTGRGVDLYRVLRAVSPAPFSAYLRFPEVEIISSSPERFLKLDRERWAETRPIKGTRPRGQTPEEDLRYRQALATDSKDRAENLMIVDLARNDLGRVCRIGTVHVPALAIVESYQFTHQLVSTVRGQLDPQRSPLDLLAAAFPPGSMTGAPKIQAMKTIARLEHCTRGIYSGAIGYFDFDGTFDLSVVIRTFIKRGDRLRFHVGGAIVADSDPAAEYQEILDKAHGMVMALELVREGL
jgi:para-aminobenzoate synthetase component 1